MASQSGEQTESQSGEQAQEDSVRQVEVCKLWLDQQPAGMRTDTYVVIFYRWLKENRFELLKTGHGDPYQHLKVDLLGLIE